MIKAIALTGVLVALAVVSDQDFVTQIGQANKAEIQVGQLGTDRGSSDAVKKFGQHMVQDHTKAGDELTAVLKNKKGFDLPNAPSAEQKATCERLQKLSGKEFDREFASIMVKDHQKVVDLVESYIKSAKDNEIKAWAQKTLPTLKHHLEMAKDLQKKIGS